jgi:hypothetical protein
MGKVLKTIELAARVSFHFSLAKAQLQKSPHISIQTGKELLPEAANNQVKSQLAHSCLLLMDVALRPIISAGLRRVQTFGCR